MTVSTDEEQMKLVTKEKSGVLPREQEVIKSSWNVKYTLFFFISLGSNKKSIFIKVFFPLVEMPSSHFSASLISFFVLNFNFNIYLHPISARFHGDVPLPRNYSMRRVWKVQDVSGHKLLHCVRQPRAKPSGKWQLTSWLSLEPLVWGTFLCLQWKQSQCEEECRR